jgi:hypothetical protein
LIVRDAQEEAAEGIESGLREIAAPVQIAATRIIRSHQQGFVIANIPRKPSRDGPEAIADAEATEQSV